MKLLKSLLLLLSITLCGTLPAQDLHYSLFDMSPLTLNPALTGAFPGTVRIGGIYRDQWAGVIDDQFTTPSVYADAPIIRGFGKKDWIGVGVSILQDEVGTLSLRTNEFAISAAYHMALDKKATSILTIGLQGGSTTRNLDVGAGMFTDELPEIQGGGGAGMGSGLDRGRFITGLGVGDNQDGINFFDLSAGLMLRTALNKTSDLEIGFAVSHITNPGYSFFSTGGTGGGNNNLRDDQKRPLTTAAHARLGLEVNDKWSLTPKAFFQSTSGATELALQAWLGREINKDFTLSFGPGYRFGDAVEALVGVDYQDLRVALAYDFNTSDLSGSGSAGSFEIAAYYIISIFKKPAVTPKVFCPKF